jgi:hypothetical protein
VGRGGRRERRGRGKESAGEGEGRGQGGGGRHGGPGQRGGIRGNEYADAPPRAHFEPSARFNYKSYEVLDYSPRGN